MENQQNKVTLILLGVFITGLLSPKPVFAYIDPGNGSYILQIVIASSMGLLFATKSYWKKLLNKAKDVFKKTKKKRLISPNTHHPFEILRVAYFTKMGTYTDR